MSKKDFTGGLNSLLGERKPEQPEPAKPTVIEPTKPEPKEVAKVEKKIVPSTSKRGTKPNETRATLIVNEDVLEKLKAIAYWERTLIKDVVNEALEEAVKRYEKKHGEIQPVPKK